jgi:hypothetical protein
VGRFSDQSHKNLRRLPVLITVGRIQTTSQTDYQTQEAAQIYDLATAGVLHSMRGAPI